MGYLSLRNNSPLHWKTGIDFDKSSKRDYIAGHEKAMNKRNYDPRKNTPAKQRNKSTLWDLC